MTWNIEGLNRNICNLIHYIDIWNPDLIFLSEPQIFEYDIANPMSYLKGSYSYRLNSADQFDPELPLLKSRATGGTLIMWKKEFDAFVTFHNPPSPAILPMVFHPPNNSLTTHICVYLPTSGQEVQFMNELANISSVLEKLRLTHPSSHCYIRGDFNVNEKHIKRNELLTTFMELEKLISVEIVHNTYHHFMGEGRSDSKLDKLLFTRTTDFHEQLENICCGLSEPMVDSHHDILISSFILRNEGYSNNDEIKSDAPIIPNTRRRIYWSDSGIDAYQEIVGPQLLRLQESWCNTKNSKNSMSLLLESTNFILNECAIITNKSVPLSKMPAQKSSRMPRSIKLSSRKLLKKWRLLKYARKTHNEDSIVVRKHIQEYKSYKLSHKRLVREFKKNQSLKRDEDLLANPSSTFSQIRRSRKANSQAICSLDVNGELYTGDRVKDGFYRSISQLKHRNMTNLEASTHYMGFIEDYRNIMMICKEGSKIAEISEVDAINLLFSLKPNVADFFAVTPYHYISAGPHGWNHFRFLLNILINDINLTKVVEINRAYACVLFKGHGKDRNSSRSYRTISSCPVIAKALDLHVRNIFIESWNRSQAATQYQGHGSSHELASLLLTESIQHSLFAHKKPVYVLYLDAKSAFDVLQRELLIKNLFGLQKADEYLSYIDHRLAHRETVIDWDGTLMGPICDDQGLEQGGISSSDLYKIYSYEQLDSAQRSNLGVPLSNCRSPYSYNLLEQNSLVVSAIGQADDTVLISNDILLLDSLLILSLSYCQKYQVEICAEKTRLQVFHPASMAVKDLNFSSYNPITINNVAIPFSDKAEHVGVIRSCWGNMPAIISRVTAHKKALASVLFSGLAKGHRANPAPSIKIERLYASPVLLSGLGSLVLSEKEISVIEQHVRETIRCLMRLHDRTPRCVTYFLAGSLPGSALIHIKQLNLFGMVCRLTDDILHHHALNVFNSHTISPKSWFHQIRRLCLNYNLPHPLILLTRPLSKEALKSLIRKKVVDYWEIELRHEASNLKSLSFFKPQYMSLCKPHPVWSTAGNCPRKVSKATIQALMISGRYRTDDLVSRWSSKVTGYCTLSSQCSGNLQREDIRHILQHCVALSDTRDMMLHFTHLSLSQYIPDVQHILQEFCDPSCDQFCDFLLDCSSIPAVITASQNNGPYILQSLFDVTRNWVYALHRQRLKLRGQWKAGE